MQLDIIFRNGKWKMENGKWKMENGEWRMENGEWRMENGEWKVVCLMRVETNRLEAMLFIYPVYGQTVSSIRGALKS